MKVQFSKNADWYFVTFRLNKSETIHQHRINNYLGLNQQIFDLGVPAQKLFSDKYVEVSESYLLFRKGFSLIDRSIYFSEKNTRIRSRI